MTDLLSTSVAKEPKIHLKQFLVEDLDPVHSTNPDSLIETSRDLVQCFLNEAWKLPVERDHDLLIAKLPVEAASSLVLPREKPVPTTLPQTKWEKFAEIKGIRKRKRESKVWDDASQEWKPRWGYKRANDDSKDWLVEIPDNAPDPKEDFFEKRSEAKKQRVAKNKLQQVRNLKRMHNASRPPPPEGTPDANSQKKFKKTPSAIKSKKQKRTMMKEKKTNKKNKSQGGGRGGR